ncbi:MAG TPA: efflux RND transporter periplasmic adaptor subunit [Chitinophagaceae bacterium]|nr:efflux RND transporter periplasmic adaptor subunit [Chitinophagaceae bacterium]
MENNKKYTMPVFDLNLRKDALTFFKSYGHVRLTNKDCLGKNREMSKINTGKSIKFSKIIVTVVLGIFLIACNNNKKEEQHDTGGMQVPDHFKKTDSSKKDIPLDALLKPVNAFVISTVPVTTLELKRESIEVPALGVVQYDYRQAGSVPARIAGRIEKLFVRYRYQYIKKGEKLLELYSPELLTSQQNLIFLVKNDPDNASLISASKQRLLLLGMTSQQISQIIATGKPLYSVSVYSTYSGYVIDAGSPNMKLKAVENNGMAAGNFSQTTEELSLKEGMYVEAGQPIINVINTNTALVSLSIFADQQSLIKVGDIVSIKAETSATPIRSIISYIEPFYSGETRSLAARAYINNNAAKIPIGSQVQATISTGMQQASWLPAGAVLSLGLNDIVFKKEGSGFRAGKVVTGVKQEDKIQILSGLEPSDSVVVNAQFLNESESFIQVKK